jgi:Na+/melibiose symporter-like transporter
MLLEVTVAILFLTELPLQAAAAVEITVAALASLAVAVVVVVVALRIMQVAEVAELAQQEEMQHSRRQLMVVNTVQELLVKGTQAVEAVDIFTLRDKVAAG